MKLNQSSARGAIKGGCAAFKVIKVTRFYYFARILATYVKKSFFAFLIFEVKWI